MQRVEYTKTIFCLATPQWPQTVTTDGTETTSRDTCHGPLSQNHGKRYTETVR